MKKESIEMILKNVVNRKWAYLREESLIERLAFNNPHLSQLMAIAEEKYYPNFVGYPINKIENEMRKKIFK